MTRFPLNKNSAEMIRWGVDSWNEFTVEFRDGVVNAHWKNKDPKDIVKLFRTVADDIERGFDL